MSQSPYIFVSHSTHLEMPILFLCLSTSKLCFCLTESYVFTEVDVNFYYVKRNEILFKKKKTANVCKMLPCIHLEFTRIAVLFISNVSLSLLVPDACVGLIDEFIRKNKQ